MKRLIAIILVLSLVLLVACQPTQPTVEPTKEPAPVVKKEPTTKPAPISEEKEMEPPKPFPKMGMRIEQVCDVLLPVEKFAAICGLQADQITLADRSSERTCWIAYTDKNNKALTAGFTAVDWQNAEEATREFDRGIGMRRTPEEKDVGTRAYKYQEIERENIVWLHGRFLTHIGASTQLCTKEQLLELAQEIDGKLE